MNDNYNPMAGPTVISYPVSAAAYGYIVRVLELGVMEGELGHARPTPEVAQILHALHVVLSGGAVKIEVTQRGNPDIQNDLARRVEATIHDGNLINEKAGYYVVLGA